MVNDGPWTSIPDAFLPAKILELCFNILHDPPDDIIKQISLLSWIPPHEVKEYRKKLDEQLENQVKAEIEKIRWKETPSYKDNTKVKLEAMCRKAGIPITPATPKHQLCSLLHQKWGESEPPIVSQSLYSGSLSSLPHSASSINQLTMPVLKTVLKFHNLPYLGTKDQLVLRVLMLRHGHADEAALKEVNLLKDFVDLAKELIAKEQHLNLTMHCYRVRKYSTFTSKTFVPMPTHINGEDDLCNLFNPLLEHIALKHYPSATATSGAQASRLSTTCSNDPDVSLKEQVCQLKVVP